MTKRSFTLVEVLVTITIIVILMSLGVAGVSKVLEGQAQSKCVMQVDILTAAIEAYYDKYGEYPPCNIDSNGASLSSSRKVYLRAQDLEEFVDFQKAGINVSGAGWVKDPWGSNYGYVSGDYAVQESDPYRLFNVNSFDLWSPGPDKLTGLNSYGATVSDGDLNRNSTYDKFNPNDSEYYKNHVVNNDDISNYSKRH